MESILLSLDVTNTLNHRNILKKQLLTAIPAQLEKKQESEDEETEMYKKYTKEKNYEKKRKSEDNNSGGLQKKPTISETQNPVSSEFQSVKTKSENVTNILLTIFFLIN